MNSVTGESRTVMIDRLPAWVGPMDDGMDALVFNRDDTFCHGNGGRKFLNRASASLSVPDEEGDDDDSQETIDEVGDSDP